MKTILGLAVVALVATSTGIAWRQTSAPPPPQENVETAWVCPMHAD